MREVLPLLRNSATKKSKIVADWYLTCYITFDALGIYQKSEVCWKVERSPVCWKLEYIVVHQITSRNLVRNPLTVLSRFFIYYRVPNSTSL